MNLLRRKGSFKSRKKYNFFRLLNLKIVPFTNNNSTSSTQNTNESASNLISFENNLKIEETQKYYKEEYSKVLSIYKKIKDSQEFMNIS